MSKLFSPAVKKNLKRILPFVVIALVVFLLSKMLADVKVQDVVDAIKNFSPETLGKAILLVAFGYVWLIGYDYLALRYLQRSVPIGLLIFTSLSAFALQRNVGPAPITGGAVRYRFYKNYDFSGADAAIITTLCGFFFTLGIILTAGLALLISPQGLANVTGVPELALRILGFLILAGLIGFLAWSHVRHKPIKIRNWEAPPPSLRLSAAQLLFGTVDIAIVAGVLYLVLPEGVDLAYPAFVGIYVLAMLTGAVSHVPGGIGVFEAMLLLLLPGADKGSLLASMLAFRGLYYLMPLLTMGVVNGIYELGRRLFGLASGHSHKAG